MAWNASAAARKRAPGSSHRSGDAAVIAAAVDALVVHPGGARERRAQARGPVCARCGRRAGAPAPTPRSRAAGLLPHAGRDPGPADVVQECRLGAGRSLVVRPAATCAARAARLATPAEWPCRHGAFRSTASAKARASASIPSGVAVRRGSGSASMTRARGRRPPRRRPARPHRRGTCRRSPGRAPGRATGARPRPRPPARARTWPRTAPRPRSGPARRSASPAAPRWPPLPSQRSKTSSSAASTVAGSRSRRAIAAPTSQSARAPSTATCFPRAAAPATARTAPGRAAGRGRPRR